MLTYLGVKNLAVIESAGLEFSSGLNVITGETGAGKSVLVGALKFLTGDRLSRAVLRDPEKKLSVEGLFSEFSVPDAELRDQYELIDEVILSREADETGRNKIFINGRAAPVTKLREVSRYLIDIHGQHENQFLFDSSRHLEFLDFFVDKNALEDYASAYRAYRVKADELKKARRTNEDGERLKQMYEFQLEEIKSAAIDPETDATLEERIGLLSQEEKIRAAAAQCADLLKEGEVSALDLVGRAERVLSGISGLSPELGRSFESLAAAVSHLNDSVYSLESVFDKLESTPGELDRLMERKYKLAGLLKKYGPGLEDVLSKQSELERALEDVSGSGERIAALEAETDALLKEAEEKAEILNSLRKKAAAEVSSSVISVLKELELPASVFETRFEETGVPDARGGISAEFYISTNAGFQPGPLASVASGGEISRVMIALKEVFAGADSIGTLLFDEIDTGISGRAAKSVAAKLKALSRSRQVIVITHLPVVAAMGDSHFHITKSETSGMSRTEIVRLDDKSREKVVATMIAGEVTPSSLLQARELIGGSKI